MALGFGQPQQPQQPQYAPAIPVASNDSHDNINGGVKELDTEIQKYFLNVDPLLNAYNCIHAGWRWVNVITKVKKLGVEKLKEERKLEIDWNSRAMNESGANFLWNETLPLIHQTASTSKTDRQVLYDLWHTHIFTIRMTLLKTYYYPTYLCVTPVKRQSMNELYGIEEAEALEGYKPIRQKSLCRYITPSQRQMDRHMQKHNHWDVEVVENPYQLNIQRYGNIISTIVTLYGIALKSDEGFAMEQFAQSYMTATLNRQGIGTPAQAQGITSTLKKFGIG
jgi:hypothetical protein